MRESHTCNVSCTHYISTSFSVSLPEFTSSLSLRSLSEPCMHGSPFSFMCIIVWHAVLSLASCKIERFVISWMYKDSISFSLDHTLQLFQLFQHFYAPLFLDFQHLHASILTFSALANKMIMFVIRDKRFIARHAVHFNPVTSFYPIFISYYYKYNLFIYV